MIPLLTFCTTVLLAADADATKLQGRWTLVSVTFDGKETPAKARNNRELLFGDGTFTAIVDGKKMNTIGFTLDSSKKPKEIELRRKGVADAALGIYSLDGDELKLCYGEPGRAAGGLYVEAWQQTLPPGAQAEEMN